MRAINGQNGDGGRHAFAVARKRFSTGNSFFSLDSSPCPALLLELGPWRWVEGT